MSKEYNLKENPTFCILGLLHTYVGPNGNVMPCCVGDMTKEPLGNINDVSDWNEIWNGEKYKEFRRNMIAGEKNPICSFCYDTEKFSSISSRVWRNMQFADSYDEYIDKLLPNGEMTTSKIKYMDFRFSNLCNQACITCGHDLSSSWYDLQSKLAFPPAAPKFIEPKDDKIAFGLIDNNIDTVTNVYFAGGEPLLSKYHWYTLEKLVENGRSSEVELVYSTNCSVLTYHGKSIFDYWKYFKSVIIMASVDEVGERFDYIRWPANWDKITQNLIQIKKKFDMFNFGDNFNFKLCYVPVISSLNVHRLKDMIQDFMDKGIFQESLLHDKTFEFIFFSNLLRNPKHLSIINMPTEHWAFVEQKLDEFSDWYHETILDKSLDRADKKRLFDAGISKIKELRKMNQDDMTFMDYENDFKMLREYSKMDAVRKTDFKKTFPELAWLYE